MSEAEYGSAVTVAWTDVVEVYAFKWDLLMYDEIVVGFHTGEPSGGGWVGEGFAGYQEMRAELPKRFPGIREDWFSEIAFPGFAPNRTTLWGETQVRQRVDKDSGLMLVLEFGGDAPDDLERAFATEEERQWLRMSVDAGECRFGGPDLIISDRVIAMRKAPPSRLSLCTSSNWRSVAASARERKFFRMRLPSSVPATRKTIFPEGLANSPIWKAEW